MSAWWQNLTLDEVIRAVVDVGVVGYLLYRLFIFIRGTRAVQLINGIVILLAAFQVSRWLNLYTLNWVMEKAIVVAAVALPIVFQPELRRALEQIGRGRLIPTTTFTEMGVEDIGRVIDQVVKAAEIHSRTRTGVLIVLERRTKLGDYTDTAVQMDALVTWELLTNIFIPNTPLHDGAVVARGSRIIAAGVWLPPAEATVLSSELGSRHRAAIGVTEHSDAVAVVVSEETGIISVANGGRLVRNLDEKSLRENLTALLIDKSPGARPFWGWNTKGGQAS